MLVGVVSDTHGKLPDAVLDAFAGVDHIVHAGDIGGPDILWALEAIAPVTAVLGNNDVDGIPGYSLPVFATVRLQGVRFLIGHVEGLLLRERKPTAEDTDVIVFGHSHKPVAEVREDGLLYLNPGTAAWNRGWGRSVAIVALAGGLPTVRFVGV